jgi:CDP-diglyceride synthetase
MSELFYKRMFLIGALWNVLGGAFIVFATNWVFALDGLAPPSPPLYYQAWIALFLTFGIGYYLVYRDMYRNTAIVALGAVGKLAFSVVFVYNMASYPGQVPRFFLIPVIGDLVFVVLFLMFLKFARRKTGRL